MHASVYEWVGRQVTALGIADADVLEIGSLNVNGTVRDWFTGEYLGIDVVDGPGVDLVISSHEMYEKPPFDVVVCCEMLEHDSDPQATFHAIYGSLRPGGYALVTTRSEGFPIHHEPDYFRFSQADIHALAYTAGLDIVTIEDDPQPGHPGVFAALTKT